MTKIFFLTLEQVLAIHYDQVERYGGSHGVRDLALLESATQRPEASFMGEDLYPTIFDKAAALMHSLILNHPFVDGNKRTGIVSTTSFLHFNSYDLKVSQNDLVKITLFVESKKLNLEQISKWLKEHSIQAK